MPQVNRRLFAVLPAAGASRRMGQPKLLLPLGTSSVIGRLLRVLCAADIEPFVLVRPEAERLRAEATGSGGIVVEPQTPPPQMRDSVEHLLRAIEQQRRPGPEDGWLLIPADHALLRPDTLQRLVDFWRRSPTLIVLPTFEGRRGHPTLLPWSLAAEVRTLPAEVGINHLIRRHSRRVSEIAVEDPTVLLDIDTPEDYEQARQLLGE